MASTQELEQMSITKEMVEEHIANEFSSQNPYGVRKGDRFLFRKASIWRYCAEHKKMCWLFSIDGTNTMFQCPKNAPYHSFFIVDGEYVTPFDPWHDEGDCVCGRRYASLTSGRCGNCKKSAEGWNRDEVIELLKKQLREEVDLEMEPTPEIVNTFPDYYAELLQAKAQ